MSIFTHVSVGTNDVERARGFYDAALAPLGMKRVAEFGPATMWGIDQGQFMVTPPRDGQPATHANGGTIGFAAPSRAAVDAFHAAALANGGRCEGAPGPRDYIPNAYGAYVRDPDGNKLCAYCFNPE